LKCKLLLAMNRTPDAADGRSLLPAGEIIEHPDAFRLVQIGCAEPADDECATSHGMTAEQLAAARHAYVRTAAGIWPEDFAAFDAGMMTGYSPDGSPIPGPNYVEPQEEDEEEPDDE